MLKSVLLSGLLATVCKFFRTSNVKKQSWIRYQNLIPHHILSLLQLHSMLEKRLPQQHPWLPLAELL